MLSTSVSEGICNHLYILQEGQQYLLPSSPLLRRAAFTSSGVTVLSLFSRVSFITFFTIVTIQQQLFLSDTTVHHSTHSRLLSISHHYTLATVATVATVATDVKETNLDHNSAFTDNKNNKNNNNNNMESLETLIS